MKPSIIKYTEFRYYSKNKVTGTQVPKECILKILYSAFTKNKFENFVPCGPEIHKKSNISAHI